MASSMTTLALAPEIRRLDEDWIETAEIGPDENGDPPVLVGLTITARLVSLQIISWSDGQYAPGDLALEGSTETGLVAFGDRQDDGLVPIVVRASAATIAETLHSGDYRFDLIASRDGLTTIAVSGIRMFRR